MGTKPNEPATRIWFDSTTRFGLITRILHWGMAYLLLWQFGVILSYRVFGPLEIIKTITWYGPNHGTVGLLTFLLVVARTLWTFANRRRRPSHARGWPGRVAAAGHVALYLTMFTVPTVGLLRIYGDGHGWSPWGFPVIPATGKRIEWMVALGNASHGIFAWTLAAFMAGHIVMVFVHRMMFRDGILSRMTGPLGRRKPSSPSSPD
ncbi:cytochrome b [Phyllobacterium sp. K27]